MNLIKTSVIINEKVTLGKNIFIDDNCIIGCTPVHTPIEKHSAASLWPSRRPRPPSA
jgi:UDP-3-O-[3-hydroxymyristoyl] glucosamine N-acyltransferase